MKHLLEISQIFSSRNVKRAEVFDEHSLKQKNSKFNEFYENLLKMRYKNDRDAARHLYNSSPTDDKYRQLKSRFRKRMLNTLFLLESHGTRSASYDRIIFDCVREWGQIQILRMHKAYDTSANLARQLMQTTRKFKLTRLTIETARLLSDHASNVGDASGFEEYQAILNEAIELDALERKSEVLLQKIRLAASDADQNEQRIQEVKALSDELLNLSEMQESPAIYNNMFVAWLLRVDLEKDYTLLLELCERSEQYYQENPQYIQSEKQALILKKKMGAYLQLGDYKNGRIAAEKAHRLLEDGSTNWFEFMDVYFLLCLQNDQILQAAAIFDKVVYHVNFKHQELLFKERWKIYEAYLNYLMQIRKVVLPTRHSGRKTFKVEKFLQDIVLYRKDQRIFTVHMLINQVLFQLEDRNYSEAHDLIDRLKGYASKQLKKKEHKRVFSFVMMLGMLSRCSFQLHNLGNFEKYLQNILQEQFVYNQHMSTFEVIPYEKLWAILYDRLREQETR